MWKVGYLKSSHICYLPLTSINYIATVPTTQSEITVIQSDDNQPRQDVESSQLEHIDGLYIIV